MPLFTSDQLVALLADAYYDAAKRNANMRAAAEALESLRATLSTEENVVKLSVFMNDQVGRAEPDQLQPALIQVREQFECAALAQEIERLADIFERDREEGWREWLRTYILALDDTGLWLTFCAGLANAALPFSVQMEPSIEQIRYYTKCMLHERWVEAYDWFLFLSRQDIQTEQRANMLAIAGEIQLYYFFKDDKAKELIEQAERLAPDSLGVLIGWAKYWLEKPGGLERAKEYAQRIIEAKPSSGDGFLSLGDYYLRAGELISAETQYQQAIRNAPSNNSGYSKLMRLYGSREWFKTRRDRLAGLIRQVIAVDPLSAYGTYLLEAELYEQNDLIEEAHHSNEKAISLDGSRLGAYPSDGYTYLVESRSAPQHEEYLTKARARFEKAIEVAPEAIDGYWGMSRLYEEQGELSEALEWCTRSLEKRPQWETFIRTRMGDLKRKLKQYEAAEQEFSRVLAVDPSHQQALDGLTDLSYDYYKYGNDGDAALRLLDTVRRLGGESFEANYQNLVGNLHYYFSRYEAAAEAYRRAIAADPTSPLYHSSLALALDQMKAAGNRVAELQEAVVALRRAVDLAADKNEHANRLVGLERDLRFVRRYGESALNLTPIPKPIRAFLQDDWLPVILAEGKSELSEETIKKIDEMRQRIQERYGIRVPGVNFTTIKEAGAPPCNYYFRLMESNVTVDGGRVPLDKKFAHTTREELAALRIEGEAPLAQHTSSHGFWIAKADWAKAAKHDLELWGAADYLLRYLEAVLEQNLGEFMDHQMTTSLLRESAKAEGADIAKSPQKLTALTVALRHLLRERLPIVPFDDICHRFLELDQRGANVHMIIDDLKSLQAGREPARIW